jgi:hypothetical protein
LGMLQGIPVSTIKKGWIKTPISTFKNPLLLKVEKNILKTKQ